MNRLAGIFVGSCLAFGLAQPCAAEVRRALLSVEGLAVPTGKTIFSYRIETFGVVFLATCRMPQSWEMKSEKYEDLEGYLAGRADVHGVELRTLTNFYLVDVYDYRPVTLRDGNAEHPASFSGWVQIGSRERFGEWHGRKVKLPADNVRLRDATSCPLPGPPLP